MNSSWIHRFQQKQLWNERYSIQLLQQRFIENRIAIQRIIDCDFGITALGFIHDLVIIGNELGVVTVISPSHTVLREEVSYFPIEFIIPRNHHSVLVIAGDHTVKCLTFSFHPSSISIQSKTIPIVDHCVGSTRLCGIYSLDVTSNSIYYINTHHSVSKMHVESLTIQPTTISNVSWIEVIDSDLVLSIQGNNTEIFLNEERLFYTNYQIGKCLLTSDQQYLVTYDNSDQCIYIYDCILPTKWYCVASRSIHQKVTPCYWKQARCFLLGGCTSGEMHIVRIDDLIPSTNNSIFCRESSRIRLDCEVITTIAIWNDSRIVIGDKKGSVYYLKIF